MALKGRNWFFKKCLDEERRVTKLAYLSKEALDLGLYGKHHTEGQILQACGATQQFLNKFPRHKKVIKKQSPVESCKLKGSLLKDWKNFLSTNNGPYGRQDFNYNLDTLKKSYLTPKYGGRRSGGGRGDRELEIVLRLMAEFI